MHNPVAEFAFSTVGAAPLSVQVDSYPALNGRGGHVVLRHGREPLLRYRVVSATDTVLFDRIPFTAVRSAASGGSETLTFTGSSGKSQATVTYRIAPDNYSAAASIAVTGLTGPAFLTVDLPHGFDSQEADSTADIRQLAYAVKPVSQGARATTFAKLDSGEAKLEPGPLSWAVAKSKYFLVGVLAPTGGKPFVEARFEGGARTRKLATNASATIVLALDGGKASFEFYAGPPVMGTPCMRSGGSSRRRIQLRKLFPARSFSRSRRSSFGFFSG